MYYAIKMESAQDLIGDMYDEFDCVVVDETANPSILNGGVLTRIEDAVSEISLFLGEVFFMRNFESCAKTLNYYYYDGRNWTSEEVKILADGEWWQKAAIVGFGKYERRLIRDSYRYYAELYYNPEKMSESDIDNFAHEYFEEVSEWVVFEAEEQYYDKYDEPIDMSALLLALASTSEREVYHVWSKSPDHQQLREISLRIGTSEDNIRGFSPRRVLTWDEVDIYECWK